MKKLLFMIPVLFFLIGNLQAQEVKKTVEKKVVIVKKTTDENGKIVEERIEATGADADKLLKEMKESGELEDIDIEIMVDEKVKVKKEKSSSNVWISKGDSKSKTIEVEIENDDGDEEEGTIIMRIKKDGMDEPRVLKWVTEGGEFPHDLKELMEKENIDIKFGDEDGKEMQTIFVEADDEDLPEVKVRMGVRVMGNGSVSIAGVEEGSSAEKAGLKEGDIITEIDDYHIENYRGLMERLAEYNAGDKIKVRYVRDGKANNASLKLAGRE
jgi:hypothetical protein